MNRSKNIIFIVVTIFLIILTLFSNLTADGRFLRGEKWHKFTVADKTADFFVSPKGNNDWSGTLAEPNSDKTDGPFMTISRAQKAVRELKKQVYKLEKIPVQEAYIGSPHKLGDGRDILVLIREGYYELDEPLNFSPDDGGERVETNMPTGAFEYHKLKDYFVTYAAYPGEEAIISGGKKITSWKKQDNLWVAKNVDPDVKSLVADGKMQTLARTPDSGYFTLPEAPENTHSFKFYPGDLKSWPDMQDNRIVMYLRWHMGRNHITKIDETDNKAYLEKGQDGIVVISPRYYIENIKSLLDAPGEWYYDSRAREVSFMLPKSIKDPNRSKIVTPVLQQLIEIKGNPGRPVRNLRIYGLKFEAVSEGGKTISFEYANNCELVESNISAVGGIAVHLGPGCFRTRIMHNRIYQAYGGGLRIDGKAYPSSWADIIRETIISHNLMDECGRTVIVAHDALYTTISHNEISNNLGRTAIYVGGWPNQEEAIDGGYRVEYNHIHHVQAWADDSGAITSGGQTYDSVIRRNLIHHVKAGLFNDNVAIWFDNLSLGWTAEENIYYALGQGEMKLCAANLVDNLYHNNHLIEKPENLPTGLIAGEPHFEFKDLIIENLSELKREVLQTGDIIRISSIIENSGETGIEKVNLYFDGKIVQYKNVALIRNNSTNVSFDLTLSEPGEHSMTIGSAPLRSISVKGEPLAVLYDSLIVSSTVLPAGESVSISARVKKVRDLKETVTANLYVDNKVVAAHPILFDKNNIQIVNFNYKPDAGMYDVRIGNSPSLNFEAYAHQSVNISKAKLEQYRAARAEPCEITIDQANNKFRLQTAGTDFFHGEDSYASVYLKEPVKGNFIATVKIVGFGPRTHEWYRAGLFIRNEMTKSFDTGVGSKGSCLMFVSPGRAGMNWDEHGDGCMHKASSENHAELGVYPMWIKLVRHGNSFSGYVSYDGKNWTVSRHTEDLPGINKAVHLGIAAGGPDQRVYFVEFEDFQLQVEEEGWKK